MTKHSNIGAHGGHSCLNHHRKLVLAEEITAEPNCMGRDHNAVRSHQARVQRSFAFSYTNREESGRWGILIVKLTMSPFGRSNRFQKYPGRGVRFYFNEKAKYVLFLNKQEKTVCLSLNGSLMFNSKNDTKKQKWFSFKNWKDALLTTLFTKCVLLAELPVQIVAHK